MKLAAQICGTPIAAISLVDEHRQWFQAITGLACRETPRDVAFCAHTILGDVPVVVPDALADQRFATNALVTGDPRIRFYAGVPLEIEPGLPLGSLCVIDTQPRELAPGQLESLRVLAGFVAAHLDLARRTNELAAQKRLMKLLFDHATDHAMITLSLDGAITSCNAGAERMTGWSASELVGRRYDMLHADEERRAGVPEALLRGAVAEGKVETAGWRARADGTRYHVTGTICAVRDSRGTCTALVKVAREDTEAWQTAQELIRKTTELASANQRLEQQALALRARTAELEQAQRDAHAASEAKSTFLANMSHEIRTPLSAILGYADLLNDPSASGIGTEERAEYVDIIRRNGEHLLGLINDILDVSKIEAGKLVVERIPTRIGDVLEEVDTLMQIKARGKGLSLELARQTPLPDEILCDPLRLRQILVNLVSNAIKFTEVGSVAVRAAFDAAEQRGPTLRIEVADTGIGMSREQVAHLFESFRQGDASTTRRYGGTGLGLSISGRLAELLGGTLTANSEPGRGSTFSLALPATVVSAERAAAARGSEVPPAPKQSDGAPSPPGDAHALRGARIALVEDGPDNQRLIAFHLRKAGAEVRVFAHGRAAREAMTVDGTIDGALSPVPAFDLIVTDMQMPETDGYALAAHLRRKGWTRGIIALTAHAMFGDAQRCLAAGCTSYASKPLDRAKFLATCASALGSSGAPRPS